MEADIQLVKHSISSSIFRAYDIRGIVDKNLSADVVYQIGLALGSEARNRGVKEIITARDGRNSSPILSLALQQGLLATGIDVIDIGAVPTPLLYFATHVLSTNSGVMLTGSHNPAEYNGLKMVLNGRTLIEEEIKQLQKRIEDENFVYGSGSISNADIMERYIERVTSEIQLKRKLKIVIDCGNGIAATIAPQLFRRLGCEVHELFCEVDGDFPNHEPDPSQPNNLRTLIHAVKKVQADIGLAFDGDADRLGIVTNQGTIIWPDRQMMLFAKDILRTKPQAKIIYDIKCTRHLAEVILQNEGIPLMWKTGHSLIKAKMNEVGAVFAGEMSGHLFFKDRCYGFDDGIYSGARLLEIISRETQDTETIFKTFPDSVNTPEMKISIAEERKFQFIDHFIKSVNFPNAEVSTIDGIRVEFSEGWALLRASNTSPCLVLRFEASSERFLEQLKLLFRRQLLAIDPKLIISF